MSAQKFVLLKPSAGSKPTSRQEVKESKSPLKVAGVATASTSSLGTRKRGRGRPKGMGRGRRSRQHRGVVPRLPPAIDVVPVVPFRLRYRVAVGSNATITRKLLAGALGGIVTVANTTLTCWASSARLSRVILWPGTAGGAQIRPADGTAEQSLQRDRNMVDQMPDGVTTTAPIVFTPNRKSYLAEWQMLSDNSSDGLFTLGVVEGVIIDVEGVFTLNQQHNASPVTITISSGALGSSFWLSLDGANNVQVLGLPSTV